MCRITWHAGSGGPRCILASAGGKFAHSRCASRDVTRKMLARIASSALANIAFGMTATMTQVALAGMISRSASAVDLGAWSVIAAFGSFAPLLSCGMAVAVARRLTHIRSTMRKDEVERHESSLMTVARLLSGRLTTTGVLLALLFACAFPLIYPDLVGRSSSATQVSAFLSVVGACWIVASQPFYGWLIAEHRNWSIALSGLAGRGAAVILAGVAIFSLGVKPLISVGACSLSLWVGLVVMRQATDCKSASVDKGIVGREREALVPIIRGFGVWSLTSAAIQASTVPILAFLNPAVATPSFLAFTLVGALIGMTSAMANALLAPIAKQIAENRRHALFLTVSVSNVILWTTITASSLAVYFLLDIIMPVWIGAQVGGVGMCKTYFAIFALQHSLRVTGVASSIAVAMGGTSRALIYSTLIEAGLFVALAIPVGLISGTMAYLVGLIGAGSIGSLAVVGTAIWTAPVADAERGSWKKLAVSALVLQLLSFAIWGAVLHGAA